MFPKIFILFAIIFCASCSHTYQLSKKQLEVRDSVYWTTFADADGNWCRDFNELRDYQDAMEEQRFSAKGYMVSDPNHVIVERKPGQMSYGVFRITEFIPTTKRKYYFAGKEMSPDSTIFFYLKAHHIRFFKNYTLVSLRDVCEPNIPVPKEPNTKYFVKYVRVDLPAKPTAVFQKTEQTVIFCYPNNQAVIITGNIAFNAPSNTEGGTRRNIEAISETVLDKILTKLELLPQRNPVVFPFLRLYGKQKKIPYPETGRHCFSAISGDYAVIAYNITDRDYDLFRAMIDNTLATRVYYPIEIDYFLEHTPILFPWLRKYYEYNNLDLKQSFGGSCIHPILKSDIDIYK